MEPKTFSILQEEILHCQSRYLLHTYTPNLVLVKGQGCRVWDIEGNEYLDFTSGVSVCNLGHCHPVVTEAIVQQAQTLVHVSNLFINQHQPLLAKAIANASFNGKLFFANSGAEANEGMIKFARKWGSSRGRYKIICMEHSFHGRTLATLSATDKPSIRQGFEPFLDGFVFVPYNNVDAVAQVIDSQTAAVLVEPIQGEGGIILPQPGYLQSLRQLCDEKGILLLLDEVQTGFGRTGTLFAYQQFGIVPDAMSMAKAIANGFPMGAFEVANQWQDVFQPGSHASTFGGTPLACAAALAVLEVFEREGILENVQLNGSYLLSQLQSLLLPYPQIVQDVRGIGLMIGVQMKTEELQKKFISLAKNHRLLLMGASQNVVRIYPPLIVSRLEIDQALERIEKVLGGML